MALSEVLVREDRTKRSGNADIPSSQYEKAGFCLQRANDIFVVRYKRHQILVNTENYYRIRREEYV